MESGQGERAPTRRSASSGPGEHTGRYRTGGDQLLTDDQGNSTISMEDYVVAVTDELEKPRASGRRLSVAC